MTPRGQCAGGGAGAAGDRFPPDTGARSKHFVATRPPVVSCIPHGSAAGAVWKAPPRCARDVLRLRILGTATSPPYCSPISCLTPYPARAHSALRFHFSALFCTFVFLPAIPLSSLDVKPPCAFSIVSCPGGLSGFKLQTQIVSLLSVRLTDLYMGAGFADGSNASAELHPLRSGALLP